MNLSFVLQGDPTKLDLKKAESILEELINLRDTLTKEVTRLRDHVKAERAKPTLRDLVIKHIEKADREDDSEVPIVIEGNFVKIRRPVIEEGDAPTEDSAHWTFRNWEWIKGFCEAHPGAMPTIPENEDTMNFDWIDCSNLNVRH